MTSLGQLFQVRLGFRNQPAHRRHLGEHALISAIFVITRAALHLAGLRFNFIVNWMFLGDSEDLRERLWMTTYYFHAYPPGMNLLTGILLKLGGPSGAATLAQVTFFAFGLVFVNSFIHLCRASGLSRWAALGTCIAFSLLPQCIYFEHLYLFECPVAALICLAAALFHRAVRFQSPWTWFAFFLACSAIAWIRSTFHLIWFCAMACLGIWFTSPGARRAVLLAACGPAVLLLALYLKNLAVFGVFGAASSGGSNLAHVTVMRLPAEVRDSWIRDGKLSPFAAISVYAPPREYLPYFGTSESSKWPELSALDRPSVHSPNFNHWFFLEVSRRRSADARYYVEQRPLEYARTVAASFEQIFQPTTTWHPHDTKVDSPHYQHRQVLGRYEALYNRIVHGFPFAPIGLYAFLPLSCLWAVRRAGHLVRAGSAESTAQGALLYFCLVQIGFVTVLSSFFTIGESARYRYQIEPMIWLIVAPSVASLCARLRLWRHASEPGSRSVPTTS